MTEAVEFTLPTTALSSSRRQAWSVYRYTGSLRPLKIALGRVNVSVTAERNFHDQRQAAPRKKTLPPGSGASASAAAASTSSSSGAALPCKALSLPTSIRPSSWGSATCCSAARGSGAAAGGGAAGGARPGRRPDARRQAERLARQSRSRAGRRRRSGGRRRGAAARRQRLLPRRRLPLVVEVPF